MNLMNLKTLGLASSPSFIGSVVDDMAGAYGSLTSGLFSQSLPPAPSSSPYSTIYSFGDSLSDVGNIYALSLHALPASPYVGGHFTNGSIWVQDLAAQLGLPSPQPSVLGGNDFAYGGAETGAEALHQQSPADLPSQLVQFTTIHPLPAANALYTISIGGNDVIDAVAAYSADPARATADITQAVANETAFVAALAADGARNFVVLNVPDLGKIPSETARGPQTAQVASSLSAFYDAQLSASLSSLAVKDHLNLHLVDTYSLLDQGIANPSAFGLTNVTQPVWTGTYNNPASGTLNANGAAQNGYLFFDGLHPTATGHQLLATAAYSSLHPIA
jgi:phospholipase/lecithinase/hemolysin